jgi:transcription factor TFIIIB component B''
VQALRQFGENYELISLIMPGRDRKACRNKFKAEDRRNPNRITWSLNNRLDYGTSPRPCCTLRILTYSTDISTLSRMTGKDFSGPTPAIRMPTPILPPNPPAEKDGAPSGSSSKAATPKPKPRRKGKTQALAPDEEIVGAADTFMDTED